MWPLFVLLGLFVLMLLLWYYANKAHKNPEFTNASPRMKKCKCGALIASSFDTCPACGGREFEGQQVKK